MCIRFDEYLLRIITKKKITQRELSKATGLTEATISGYISGDRQPSISNLAKISKALDVKVDELLFGGRKWEM